MTKKLTRIIILTIVSILFATGCSGGGAGSSGQTTEQIEFAEALSLYLLGGLTAGLDAGLVSMDSDFNGTLTQAEIIAMDPENANATGSIDYDYDYNDATGEAVYTLTFNSFSFSTIEFSSTLSGTTVEVSTTGSQESTSTGTLTYAGGNMVLDVYTDDSGNPGGTITYKGTVYNWSDYSL